MMNTKLLAVRFPSSVDRVRSDTNHLQKLVEVDDPSTIKTLIGEMLFNVNVLFRYNYCLINHGGQLYVIEPVDYVKNTYARKLVSYHPLSHLV